MKTTAPESLDREDLEQLQLGRLRRLLQTLWEGNAFYRRKLGQVGVQGPEDLVDFDHYRRLPFTTKAELTVDQQETPPYGSNMSFAPERYVRLHQTSGTTGAPLRWLDTEESWHWWGQCWAQVYRAAGVGPQDRVFFAFSFGPFVGFWSAYEGCRHLGALAIPGGGMGSELRLRAILGNKATVLVCTPTYALHLAEVARAEGLDLANSAVRVTIHAGEPGAGLPATRARLEAAWGARAFDHAGATEVGAWGFECEHRQGLHLNEGEFVFEVFDPQSGLPAEAGELVVTNLGRAGMPVIRYRTGDRAVLQRQPCACGRRFLRLEGGVTGRLDDVLIVRGVNIYPSAVENVIRGFDSVGEFAVRVRRRGSMDEIEISLEVGDQAEAVEAAVAQALRTALGLRVRVEVVAPGSLPRFELKARRFSDLRPTDSA
jgi:phenylacetate-CoA ligase